MQQVGTWILVFIFKALLEVWNMGQKHLHYLVHELTPSATLVSILDTTKNIEHLRQIHAHFITNGTITDPLVASRLLTSPSLVEFNYTHSIFTQIPSPNLFTWNTMIKKHVDSPSNSWLSPLLLYRQMLDTGLNPNGHTFMYMIKALSLRKRVDEGEAIHSHVVKFGYGYSEYIASALIGFDVAGGFLGRARRVFDELCQPGLILWTTMLRAYVCGNCPKEALVLFGMMRRLDVMPDPVALATILTACGQLGSLDVTKMMHGFMVKSGIEIDGYVCSVVVGMYGDNGSLDLAYQFFSEVVVKNVVVWNTMIHQCVQHANIELAQRLFQKMVRRDVVSWNTMIGGLSRVGRCREAVALFHEMELCGVKPNKLTLLSTLSACASLGGLETATWIHGYTEKNRLNSDGSLDPGLIDMYSKCGNIDKAMEVFEKVQRRDVFSWTAIICGLAMHGHGKQAVNKFCEMQEVCVQPDDVVFVGVLNACAHAGMLDEGWEYFTSMKKDYNLTPKIEHYGCMVDLLGRIGRVKEAYDLIKEMPMEPNEVIWGTLLSACRVHNDAELGEVVATRMIELDASDPWIRVMLANIYADACKWDGAMKLRKEQKKKGLKKAPGCSSIEVNGMVNEFLVGDSLHPQQSEIDSMLESIESILKLR